MNNEFLLYENAEDYYSKYFSGSKRVNKQINFVQLEDSVILPHRIINGGMWGGGIVTRDGKYIESTAVHTKSGHPYHVTESEIENVDETVLYLGMFNGVWGHCITDNIKRLWFLQTEYFKNNCSKLKLVYIPIIGFNMHENFRKLLSILDVDAENLAPITKPTRYKSVILPDESFYTEDGDTRFFTKEYEQTINQIIKYAKSNYVKTDFQKIYLTFSSSEKMYGETNIERFFEKNGYKIVDFGKKTLDEQLNILLNCKSLAGTIGSSTHNAVFLNEGSELILIPRAYYLTGYQVAINEVRNLNVKYVDATLSDGVISEMPYMGPFFVYKSDELKSLFPVNQEQENHKESLKEYLFYKTYCEIIHRHNSIKAPDYYQTKVKRVITKWKHETGVNNSWMIIQRTKSAISIIINRIGEKMKRRDYLNFRGTSD